MNVDKLIRFSERTVLSVCLAVLITFSPGCQQASAGTKPLATQNTEVGSVPHAICEVHEGGSIKSALTNIACMDIIVYPGDYRGEGLYKLERNGVTLQANGTNGEVIVSSIVVYGNNNVVRGFTITDREQKTGIRTYGNNNLIENNEIYDTAEDGMWLWGIGNVIHGNYIHDIYDDRDWPAYDQHVDCFMTFSWDWPVEDLLIDGNTCVLDRLQGSNQFFILTHNENTIMKDITFSNNIFIAKDTGYVPVAFFGDDSVTGLRVVNNTFYNTSGQGEDAVWAENVPDVYIANNAIIGYDSVVRIVESGVVEENNIVDPPYGMRDIQGFDFHLLSDSPLIDAGLSLGVEYDFDGNLRDESMDIGAFEFQKP
jgi:hypothetical protein